MNEITKSSEAARREAQAWLSRSLAWARTLDRLRGHEPGAPDEVTEATVAAPAVPHRDAA